MPNQVCEWRHFLLSAITDTVILTPCAVWGKMNQETKMKKTLALALVVIIAGTAAYAGALVDPIVEPVVIIEEASSSSSAGLLIPLLLLVILGAALL